MRKFTKQEWDEKTNKLESQIKRLSNRIYGRLPFGKVKELEARLEERERRLETHLEIGIKLNYFEIPTSIFG